jgi:serine/threonine-protein kinase
MSPEQVRCAKDVDGRTDVWSLAVTLYELLCGVTPFAHESVTACIAAIIADPVPDPRRARADLPGELVAVLLRALEKEADDRYPSVEAFVEALAPFALGAAVARVVVEAEPPSREPVESGYFPTVPQVSEEPSVPVSRRRLRSSLGVAFAAALAVGAVVLGARASAPEARASVPDSGATSRSDPSSVALPAPPAPALSAPARPAPPALPAPESPAPEPRFEVVLSSGGAVAATNAFPVARTPLAEVDPPSPSRAPTVGTVRAARGSRAARPASSGVHGGLSSPGF